MPHTWRAFAKPSKKLHLLDRVELGAGKIAATVTGKGDTGEVTLSFDLGGAALDDAIRANGSMPLPPYIEAQREPEARDAVDYQTVYAAREGAVAAPTAGLHFTEALLQRLSDKGVTIERLTLHVGAGTFLPVKADDTDDHVMHAEWGEIDAGDRRADQGRQGQGWPGRRGGDDQPAAARKRGAPDRHAAAVLGRHRHLHHAGLQVPRGGPAASPTSICRARRFSCWCRRLPA